MPLADRYRISRAIKRGGMAEILEAFVQGDGGFERRVAIKRLLPGRESDPTFVRGFIDEARIVSQLHHANIVAVFDFGITPEGPLLVIEHVDGLDVASMCKRAVESGAGVPAEVALAICADVARALDYAHRAVDADGRPMGIVHRDVSPENVLLSFEGDVKLTDFGIAFALRRLEETRVGIAKGKLEFMAPEQLRAQDVDTRADVFALGCVLHFMLTGRSPVDGERATWEAVGERRLDVLPEDVARIVERATRIDRAQRHASAGAFAREAAEALSARKIGDVRSLLQEWASRWKPNAPPAKPKHRAGELIELALIAGSEVGGRRFESVLADSARAPSSPDPSGPSRLPSGRSVAGRRSSARDASSPARAASSPEAQPSTAQKTELVERKRLVLSTTGRSGPTDARPDPLGGEPIETTQASRDPLLGAMVHGFRVVEAIAYGNHATTYRAQHAALDRECAISVLEPRDDLGETLAKRLFRDMEAIARLAPPNVVVADDCGFAPDGRPFILTKPVRGRTLSRVLREDAPIDPRRAWTIARAIASALLVPHDAGVCHGELGPNAVMISGEAPYERVDILDVGLAPALREGTDAAGDIAALGGMIIAMAGDSRDLLAAGLRSLGAMLEERDPSRPISANATVAMLDRIAPVREGHPGVSDPHESLPGEQVDEAVTVVPPKPSLPANTLLLVAVGMLLAVLAIAAVLGRSHLQASSPAEPAPPQQAAIREPEERAAPKAKAKPSAVAEPSERSEASEPREPPATVAIETARAPEEAPRKEKRAPVVRKEEARVIEEASAPPPPAEELTQQKLEDRLRRVADILRGAEQKIDAAELNRIESSYLELRVALDDARDDDARRALAKRIEALERRLKPLLR